jgi:hypothetical protein
MLSLPDGIALQCNALIAACKASNSFSTLTDINGEAEVVASSGREKMCWWLKLSRHVPFSDL